VFYSRPQVDRPIVGFSSRLVTFFRLDRCIAGYRTTCASLIRALAVASQQQWTAALSSGQSCVMQRDQLFEIFFQIGELLIAAGVTPDEQRIMHCL
jgi:hypothetical protein